MKAIERLKILERNLCIQPFSDSKHVLVKILREPDETEFRIVQVSVGQYINSLAKNRKVIPYDNFKNASES